MRSGLFSGSATGAILALSVVFAPSVVLADTEAVTEEIIVTAQRRAQSVKDTGLAINVLSGRDLVTRGIGNVTDLQHHTPALEITPAFGGGQPQFRLRGVGFEDYATNNTPTVGIYVDEVAFPVPAATQGVLFDIDRVEVLRGPQGTLYGRNTTGGAINFLTRRPTETEEAGFIAEYGSHERFRAEGYVSGPLTDTLKGRVSAVTEQGGAWQENRVTGEELGNARRYGVRGQLLWTPSDRFDGLLNLHYGRDHSDGSGGYLLTDFATAFGAGPTIPADRDPKYTGWGLSQNFANLVGVGVDTKPSRRNESAGLSATLNWAFDGVKLTSITAYDRLERKELNDWDASSYQESDTYWQSGVDVFSQEVRLASTKSEGLKWLGGLYYGRQGLNEVFLTDFSGSLGFITDTSYKQEVESLAAFGQVEYDLAPKLTLIVGLRYEHEDRDLKNFATAIGGAPTFTNGSRSTSFDEASGKLGLEFRPAARTLLYAHVSRGVKSGGFTVYNSPSEAQIDAFEPEILVAYEAGFKAQLHPTFYANGSVFYYDYQNQQVLTTILHQTYGAIGRIANAPKSKITGAELEGVWTPVPGLSITQTLAYKKGEYREFFDLDATSVQGNPTIGYTADYIDRKGQSLGFPELSYNGAVSYVWNAAGFDWRAGVDYSYRDKLTSWLGNDFDIDSYWLANADLSFRPQDSKFGFALYGRNIFDTEYDVTRNYFLPNARVGWAGRPASWGVRIQYNY
ncbi:MAG: TonB-dependent receptor [Asticcacaulis sp.]